MNALASVPPRPPADPALISCPPIRSAFPPALARTRSASPARRLIFEAPARPVRRRQRTLNFDRLGRFVFALIFGFLWHQAIDVRADPAPRAVLPNAIVDLRTREGIERVGGQWRYGDTSIREIAHRDVGADLKATGPTNQTFDFGPDAHGADFDDSKWDHLDPTTLEQRRGHGRLSLNWYRLHLTVPEKVGGFDTRGATVVFEIVVDDYAEVWVNGRLPFVLGQNGGTVAAGWNAPNRVVLTRDAKPGERFTVAVLGINGPLSTHPDTYIWVRGATLDFFAPGRLSKAREVRLEVDRQDAALDTILPSDLRLEKLADGFVFTEGPVWVPAGGAAFGPEGDEGHLLFSDPNNNTIYRLTSEGEVGVALPKSGYSGADIGEYRQPGSNGLALDRQGRLTICQHGNRRVVRIEKNGLTTVLADRFEGLRLNSPNDLAYRSDGTLFFTDPPFGLPKFGDDPRRELSHAGVYSVRDGRVRLVAKDFTGPNGLAFSPDEKFLYVGDWDDHRKVVFRYPVNPDGTLGQGEAFADLTSAPGEDAIDGLKVDGRGNVYVSGPGGLWIFDAAGKRLGKLQGPEHPHNMAWGDPDRRTLYLAAQTGIYRLRLKVAGSGAWPTPEEMVRR
ncbi:MAG TPA: SMP-30/gluconolactonase/LRE family protein [Candidatus Limnocylindria bacterium]|jgi:gluconolactonase|nr:SMP-30/gluconolactonase/LRE family protein [Candidatus Limnocylindria bacterium]